MTGHLQNLTSDSLDPSSDDSCESNYSLAFYSGLFAFGGWYAYSLIEQYEQET